MSNYEPGDFKGFQKQVIGDVRPDPICVPLQVQKSDNEEERHQWLESQVADLEEVDFLCHASQRLVAESKPTAVKASIIE